MLIVGLIVIVPCFSLTLRSKPLLKEHGAEEATLNMVLAAGVPPENGGASAVAEMLTKINDDEGGLNDPVTVYRFYLGSGNDTANALKTHANAARFRRDFPGTIRELMRNISGEDHYSSEGYRSLDGCYRFYKAEPLSREAEFVRKFGGCVGRIAASPSDAPVMFLNMKALISNGLADWGNRGLLFQSFMASGEDMFQCIQATSREEKKMTMGHVIVDLDGIGFTDLRLVSRLLTFKSMDEHFPPYLFHSVSMINAPSLFPLMFRAFSYVMSERAKKIYTVMGTDYREQFLQTWDIDLGKLPKFIGGGDPRDRQCLDKGELSDHVENETFNKRYWDMAFP